MDLLKKVAKDPGTCQMAAGEITVSGKSVPSKQTVKFKGTETREYTFEQVVFYLMNRDKKYTAYMTLCRESGIGKIYYTDQKIIMEEIDSFEEAPIAVRIGGPEFRYVGLKDYSYLRDVCMGEDEGRGENYYVIVPQSISSPVNLSNIQEFFEDGRCSDGTSISEAERVEFRLDGIKLVAVDDAAGFTGDDWKRVVCIFLDGSKWQISRWNTRDVAEMLSAVPSFHLVRSGMQSTMQVRNHNTTEISVRGGAVGKASLDSIKEKVKRCILGM